MKRRSSKSKQPLPPAKRTPPGTFADPTPRLLPSESSRPSAAKRMLAYQIERVLAQQNIPRSQLAVLMGTSRAAVNRLLDPENHSVTLQTIERVSQILGKKLHIFLYDKEGWR